MKCLPNCQNIDMSDTRYIPFWRKMAERRLPLLAHTGGGHTVPAINKKFAASGLLRTPLEGGVTVIAAQWGTSSGVLDGDCLYEWVGRGSEVSGLFGEI